MLKQLIIAVIFLSLAVHLWGADAPAPVKGQWVPISDAVLAKLESEGLKPAFPGKTAGITVDPATGDVFMVVAGQGLWKSTDHGNTFARCDAKHIGGRCETGAALQFDPRGKRLACFMLDGLAGITLDGGTTWDSFAGVGRNWDFAAVDWSAEKPLNIFALHHESNGEMYLTNDGGHKWNQVAKDKTFSGVGIIDAHTLLLTKAGGEILRSTDAGVTWNKVSDALVTSHVVSVFGDAFYLISNKGLIRSTDKGITWNVYGTPVDATFGPIFKDEKAMIVWGKKGIQESTDAGATWTIVAPVPDIGKWDSKRMLNIGWDTKADIFYASCMSMPAYRWER